MSITIEDDAADEINEDFTIQLAVLNPWPVFRNTSTVIIEDNGKSVFYTLREIRVTMSTQKCVYFLFSRFGPGWSRPNYLHSN